MKKSLVALAVLAATGAYAQSTVTLYGIVEATADVGYSQKGDVTTTVNGVSTVSRTETKNSFRIQDGNSQGSGTSRIGFRGTEDLGGGLKANFQLEMGLRVDDGCVTVAGSNCSSGNSGGNLFGRNAWGGVSGSFGEVRVGRQVLGSFSTQANGWSAGSSNGLYDAGASTAPVMGGVRFSNAVKYITPNFSGFSANFAVAAPETAGTTNSTTGNVTSTAGARTGFDLALDFANGPIYAGIGYNRNGSTDTTTGTGNSVNNGKIDAYTLSGSYDLGVVKPFVNYTRQKTNSGSVTGTTVANTDRTDKAWFVGLRAPVGAFTVITGYGRNIADTLTSSTGSLNDTAQNKRNAFQIGAQYALSKRTLLEANYGQNKGENNAVTVARTTTTVTNDKTSAFNVGLKHSF